MWTPLVLRLLCIRSWLSRDHVGPLQSARGTAPPRPEPHRDSALNIFEAKLYASSRSAQLACRPFASSGSPVDG